MTKEKLLGLIARLTNDELEIITKYYNGATARRKIHRILKIDDFGERHEEIMSLMIGLKTAHPLD